MSLQIIGTNFGRTGTDSMRIALNTLGLGPCHHMHEVSANPLQKQMWRAVARGVAPDWRQLFFGFHACVDWPSAFYWPELIEVYPRARVILTWRDPDDWYQSFEKTILPLIEDGQDGDSLLQRMISQGVFSGRAHDRHHAIAIYRANMDRVMRSVPPGRLLVHRLGDGWEPLCRFLDRPIPAEPYPSSNSAREFTPVGDRT